MISLTLDGHIFSLDPPHLRPGGMHPPPGTLGTPIRAPKQQYLILKRFCLYQYGRNEDKVLKCTFFPSDIDSIHNSRPKPSFGDIWSSARGPRHPPPFQELWWLKMKDWFITSQLARLISHLVLQQNLKTTWGLKRIFQGLQSETNRDILA